MHTKFYSSGAEDSCKVTFSPDSMKIEIFHLITLLGIFLVHNVQLSLWNAFQSIILFSEKVTYVVSAITY
jgi:hypothetical protein